MPCYFSRGGALELSGTQLNRLIQSTMQFINFIIPSLIIIYHTTLVTSNLIHMGFSVTVYSRLCVSMKWCWILCVLFLLVDSELDVIVALQLGMMIRHLVHPRCEMGYLQNRSCLEMVVKTNQYGYRLKGYREGRCLKGP